MVKRFCSILLIFIGCIHFNAVAQDSIPFKAYEDTLIKLGKRIWACRDDSSRIIANNNFFQKFRSVLSLHGSYKYPFDSLKDISHLKSDDNRIRITSWNIPINNGSYRYFGFLETAGGELFPLLGKSSEIQGWQNLKLPAEKWYGAVYFKIIKVSYSKTDYYTLLGWDGHDAVSNYKLIDVLTLDVKGNPSFGSPVFKTAEGVKNRVIIEYAEKANALLRYDYQTQLIPRGKTFKKKKTWMIVTDRLIPMDPSMKGIRKYYVPAGDTYDAFIFRDGFWTLVEDVEVTNSPASK